jgi:cation diffusion facilitator CzcD-associated flavoprotein CzcO
MSDPQTPNVDAVVIGAGFGGMLPSVKFLRHASWRDLTRKRSGLEL